MTFYEDIKMYDEPHVLDVISNSVSQNIASSTGFYSGAATGLTLSKPSKYFQFFLILKALKLIQSF